MTIAIIPARGGSQRIPKKNIKDFCGKPIIAWSIEAAKKSGLFTKIIVSTDDPDIARIANFYGAETPFIRPADISDDFATTSDVICHAIIWLNNANIHPDYICCIYPTAPLIDFTDLEKGYEVINQGCWDYVFTAYESKVYRAFVRGGKGLKMIFPEYSITRSQDLPMAMNDAGQFYWGRSHAWLEKKNIFAEESCPIMIPNFRVQDIDTLNDWKLAEHLFSCNKIS